MIFDSVNSVLRGLDETGQEQYGDDWQAKLGARIEALAEEYRTLRNADRDLIDYSDITSQAAYAFMYMAGHADFVSQILKKARATMGAALFGKKALSVTSLGGGPGSELLGLIDYLESSDEGVTKIDYWVLEKEPAWKHLTKAVVDIASDQIEIKLHFICLDPSDDEKCGDISLEEDDLVILSFFISEVCATKYAASVRASLDHLFSTMPDRSLLLYNDSNAYSFYSFLNGRVNAARKFNQFLEIEDELTVRSPKFTGMIKEYMTRTERCPKLSSNAVAKVLRREL